jgi:hypothetical protein
MEKDDDRGTGLSRRRLLAAGGAAGAGLFASGGVIPGFTGTASAASGVPANTGYYGRIFPQLEPFASVNSTVIDALMEVGERGGIMDALDNLAAGPKALITDPAVNGNRQAPIPTAPTPTIRR